LIGSFSNRSNNEVLLIKILKVRETPHLLRVTAQPYLNSLELNNKAIQGGNKGRVF
jgi:hypothetical protein